LASERPNNDMYALALAHVGAKQAPAEEGTMKTILVPLDGSALAEQVLPYARALAQLLNSEIHLLRVLPDVEPDTGFAEAMIRAYGVAELPEALRQRTQRARDERWRHAESYLATRALDLWEAGLHVTTEVLVGPPSNMIVEEAASQGAALIVMSTHGYSGIKRLTLGSVTEQVMHTTTTPIFVVHGALPMWAAGPAIRRILVPLDGSDQARQALPLAIELARAAPAELILLEAIAPTIEAMVSFRPLSRPIPRYGEILEQLHYQALRDLEMLAAPLRDEGLRVQTVIMNGPAAEVIVDEAALREADLIVMATHGYSGLKRLALGSVADQVLHTAIMPLVLVRAHAVEEEAEKETPASLLVHR
jgi:nucleotide-binding universal stress UspA family protein